MVKDSFLGAVILAVGDWAGLAATGLSWEGVIPYESWIMVGPGISSTLTLVPFGPVSFSLDLRSFARAELLVVGTESVVVAPEFLNQLALVFLGARLLSSLLL